MHSSRVFKERVDCLRNEEWSGCCGKRKFNQRIFMAKKASDFTKVHDVPSEDNHSNPEQLLRELHDGGFSKHRSCWRHLAACRQGEKGKMTESEMIEMKFRFGRFTPCLSDGRHCRKRSQIRSTELALPRWKMSDTIFNTHLEKIWRSLSDDNKTSFTHVDSLCFYLYQQKRPRALELIKRKDIFSKKYVFVPIVCWDHWRLVVLCHFGEDAYSNTRSRCILLLDSAESCAQVIGPDLRKFVFDIFQVEGRPESKDDIYRIPLLVPKVPQQKNEYDCGRFVLYFMKMFIEAAPEDFSMSNGYPYFLKPDWFDYARFEKFCDSLETKIPTHKQHNWATRRMSQRIRNTRTSSRKPSLEKQKVDIIFLED